ncbi:nucleic acid-binding, OB-fold protein [Tanacetum coccineum]|uniref:Nucleic acid-binding, OB-fold protein n=1 Tax=Tanacetum coccineum TaxID=301880 RepID=A0ABQ5BBB9_9ASTR
MKHLDHEEDVSKHIFTSHFIYLLLNKPKVKIDGIRSRKGWNFPGCGGEKCKKGVVRKDGSFWCQACEKAVDYPVLRFLMCLDFLDLREGGSMPGVMTTQVFREGPHPLTRIPKEGHQLQASLRSPLPKGLCSAGIGGVDNVEGYLQLQKPIQKTIFNSYSKHRKSFVEILSREICSCWLFYIENDDMLGMNPRSILLLICGWNQPMAEAGMEPTIQIELVKEGKPRLYPLCLNYGAHWWNKDQNEMREIIPIAQPKLPLKLNDSRPSIRAIGKAEEWVKLHDIDETRINFPLISEHYLYLTPALIFHSIPDGFLIPTLADFVFFREKSDRGGWLWGCVSCAGGLMGGWGWGNGGGWGSVVVVLPGLGVLVLQQAENLPMMRLDPWKITYRRDDKLTASTRLLADGTDAITVRR